MTTLDFARQFLVLRGRPFSFEGRPYLYAPYTSRARRIVLRASRQVEKTTFIINKILHLAVAYPGIRMICVFPRHQQATVFSRSRLLPILEASRHVRHALLGRQPRRLQVMNLSFKNKSELFIRAAYHTADAARGLDGDVLFIDEYQDAAPESLAVLAECLSHSEIGRVFLTGTPKTVDNPLEGAFCQSTANEWRIACPGCGQDARLDEHCLGPLELVCPECQERLDVRQGRWVPRNPDSAWGDGYWINHLMVPWLNYRELLERRRTYDPAVFKNECMGLPSVLGDHVVTRAEMEACCTERPMARGIADIPHGLRGRIVAGIDWSGGVHSRTVLAVGAIRDDDHVEVYYLERFPPTEDPGALLEAAAQRCRQFRVCAVAADGAGNGAVYNNQLLHRLPGLRVLYGMFYSNSDQPPSQYKGRLWNWTIGRTPSIAVVFTRVRERRILFPRVEEAGSFLDEICCEVAEHDDAKRKIRYTHPATQPDDALHAVNYLAAVARHWLDCQLVYR